MARAGTEQEPHFESMARQAASARFGMWVFLASEVLLFGALFALYASYRSEWPEAFAAGVGENDALLGTCNTLLLIFGSFLVALGTHQLAAGKARPAAALVAAGAVAGAGFLVIKSHEYATHFAHGIFPGGHGVYFEHALPGSAIFFTLYFTMTGLHAIHVTVGLVALAVCAVHIARRRLAPHGMEVVALYWHLVDAIWIVLWPLFYLTRGG